MTNLQIKYRLVLVEQLIAGEEKALSGNGQIPPKTFVVTPMVLAMTTTGFNDYVAKCNFLRLWERDKI